MKVIIIGGLIPAALWAITSIFQKLSAQSGTPPTVYLAIFGLVIFLAGVGATMLLPGGKANMAGMAFAGLAGISFAIGTGAISFALWRYDAPISKLTPILNTNILLTVAIGLLFLKEATAVNVWQLALGALLVMAGATIAATA